MTHPKHSTAALATEEPPESFMMHLAFGALISQALYTAAKLGIADLLIDKPRTVNYLAAQTATNEDALYRVMRSLASHKVFSEIEPRVFALTRYAETLRSDVPNSLRRGAIFMGEAWHWQVWGNMLYSVKTGEPAWSYTHGAEVFDYLTAHPAHAAIFNDAMTDMTAGTAPAIVEAYDFSNIKTLADIAGGHGLLLAHKQVIQRNRV